MFQKKHFKKTVQFHDQKGLKFLQILQAAAILDKKLKIFMLVFLNFNSSFF